MQLAALRTFLSRLSQKLANSSALVEPATFLLQNASNASFSALWNRLREMYVRGRVLQPVTVLMATAQASASANLWQHIQSAEGAVIPAKFPRRAAPAVGEAVAHVTQVLVMQRDDCAHVRLLVVAAAVLGGLACQDCDCVCGCALCSGKELSMLFDGQSSKLRPHNTITQ